MLIDFSKKKFDIIIAAGQSNCEGAGIGDVEDPYAPKNNVWSMNDFVIAKATERIKGNTLRGRFVLHFADEYLNAGLLDADREILIISAAQGGTGFATHEWNRGDALAVRMLEMTKTALELNTENKIVAFLWHQGEREVSHNMTAEAHLNNVRILLGDLQAAFGKNFPMITADLVPIWKAEKGELATKISDATRQAFAEVGGSFVDTDGLTSNFEEVAGSHEKIHFSRKAVKELGQRYFAAYNNKRE
ncbi:sialate O-acetylesterase [Candidatus Epulonipiscium viviparus]|uniref:sialate O-acetylesterase n=1 Tax=Candidatus Epulonipiscium viviparus TaxID=420336 RepID=UPI0004962D2B|nr:sialate O-acetylesterase [Candidatus Epulopiscium viviparus]